MEITRIVQKLAVQPSQIHLKVFLTAYVGTELSAGVSALFHNTERKVNQYLAVTLTRTQDHSSTAVDRLTEVLPCPGRLLARREANEAGAQRLPGGPVVEHFGAARDMFIVILCADH